jgi:hypothetical protein
MSNDKIIVWDPAGEYWQGGIVDEPTARALSGRGVVMLPVVRELLKGSAISGFFFRAWGAGWPIDGSVPRMCCPMILRVAPFDPSKATAANRIYWAARVVADGQVPPDWRPLGTVRIASDTGQQGAFGTGLTSTDRTVVDLAKLSSRPDEDGGWTIGGDALFASQVDMTFGLGLYCSGRGLRIAWAAVSQAD